MTSYFFGSSIRTPPTCTNSAITSGSFIELIFSTSAGGNVFSIPNKIPIFFTDSSPNKICHPERSDCFAKRSNHAVEGPLPFLLQNHCLEAFSLGLSLLSLLRPQPVLRDHFLHRIT